MCFIPLGRFLGAPVPPGYYIWKSMIPAALGNILGGGLFVGTAYWYLYLTGEGDIEIDFNIGPLNSAEEAGGPMGSASRGNAPEKVQSQQSEQLARDPHAFPHSGNHLASGIGRELSDDSAFAKNHAERMRNGDGSSEEKV